MTARKAMPGVIRKICLWCQGGSSRLVRECANDLCPLYARRLAEDGDDAELLGCIAAFCLGCAGSPEGVAECSADSPIGVQPPCPAHPFRNMDPADLPPQAPAVPQPVQQVRPLPGLGNVCQPCGSPVPAETAPADASGERDGREKRPCTPADSRHDGLQDIYSCRAPEALDI